MDETPNSPVAKWGDEFVSRFRALDPLAWTAVQQFVANLVFDAPAMQAAALGLSSGEVASLVLERLASSRALADFDESKGDFRNYIFMVRRSAIIDRIRQEQRHRHGELLDQQLEDDADFKALQAQERRELFRCWMRLILRPEDQDLLERRFFQQQELAEIVSESGLTYAAVTSRIFRSCKKLRDVLPPDFLVGF